MKAALYKKNSPACRVRSQNPFFKMSGVRDLSSKALHSQPFFGQTEVDSSFGLIQPKLTIGQPGDKYEREADAVAEQVMRMPDPLFRKQTYESEEEMPMLKAQSSSVQMKCTECEKEEENLHRKPLAASITPFFQRQEADGAEVNDRITTTLKDEKNSGQPLPGHTQNWMESRFGTDFSRVRIHTDSQAIQMSRNLHAQAFTYGSDIYFNQGKFNPGSADGKRLLAHELTHTIQQQGTIQRKEDPFTSNSVATGKAKEDHKPLLPGYTQCDFLDNRISHQAQRALYHLYLRGGMYRQASLSILGAVQGNMLQGIYKEDQGKPALMARDHGTFWWQLIPKEKGAIVYEAAEPPMMIFQNHIAGDRAALGEALWNAWNESSLSLKAVIIPPPSLQPCPIVLDTVEIEGERCSMGFVWNPETESCECQPGLIWDPETEICKLPIGPGKPPCTDAQMAKEFQRQENNCALYRSSIDMLCKLPVANPCSILAPGGLKGFNLPKSSVPILKDICRRLGGKRPECDEPRADFYERCIVSSVIGGKENMTCNPGTGSQILEKYRRWPGREK